MYEVTIRNRFAAAHSLVDYQGPCSRVHGHTWYVEVSVCGSELNQLGMLIDFHELKRLLNNIIEQLDHQNLNFLEPFVNGKGANPTAENLAKVLGGMQGPLYGFAGVLQGTLRSFVYALEAIRQQRAGEA